MPLTPRLYLLGERAAVLESPPPATLQAQRRVWALAQGLRASGRYRDVVPGMNNLTVVYDPLADDGDAVLAALAAGWEEAAGTDAPTRRVDIPVHYGGGDGPDLELVARHCGLHPDDVVQLHSQARYTVFFVGFQPGFAYLGGLPEALATPRLATPRPSVPAGSVAIGGAQTGVYPQQSPGGWNLIGRTALALFDPARDEPSLLQPGDSVRFVAEAACWK